MSRRETQAAKDLAARVNRKIIEYDRREQGAEYEPGSSWDYAELLARWERLLNGLLALDRVLREPFGKVSARVLATSATLYSQLDSEVFLGLTHLGRALGDR